MKLFKPNNRKESAKLNAIIGFISLFIPIFLQFFSRKYFLDFLNIEYLGIAGTFTSILSTLSLTELGFQNAIVFCLYKPLKDGNKDEINSLINILRIIYKYIGIFFLIIPYGVMFSLPYVLKGIEMSNIIYVYFIIDSFSTSMSYFLAYKRCLLFADQKEYISKLVDLGANILFVIIQILVLVIWQSFLLFLLVNVLRVITSNVIIQAICKKIYPYLHKSPFSKEKFNEIWIHTKNIAFLRLAGYAYTSSGNIIISSFVNTAAVGFLGNYTLITNKLVQLANGVLSPITPIIGELLLEKNEKKNEKIFRNFSFIRFLIALFIVVPFMTLINDFITWWLGEKYILSNLILFLLSADMYLNIYYTATSDFISASGLFRIDKNIAIIGAIFNIINSIILASFWGLSGVLSGIIISQLFFWIARSYIVYSKCFSRSLSWRAYISYWKVSFSYIIMSIISYLIISYIYNLLKVDSLIIKIVIGGIFSLLALTIFVLFCFKSKSEFKYLISIILKKK